MGKGGVVVTGMPRKALSGMTRIPTMAIPMPTTPATTVATTDSSMMEKKMRRLVAPKERRTPISWMRWRTVTSEMLTRLRAPSSMTNTPAAVTTWVKVFALELKPPPWRLSSAWVEP